MNQSAKKLGDNKKDAFLSSKNLFGDEANHIENIDANSDLSDYINDDDFLYKIDSIIEHLNNINNSINKKRNAKDTSTSQKRYLIKFSDVVVNAKDICSEIKVYYNKRGQARSIPASLRDLSKSLRLILLDIKLIE